MGFQPASAESNSTTNSHYPKPESRTCLPPASGQPRPGAALMPPPFLLSYSISRMQPLVMLLQLKQRWCSSNATAAASDNDERQRQMIAPQRNGKGLTVAKDDGAGQRIARPV